MISLFMCCTTDSGSRLLSMNADRPTMPSSQDGVIGLFFHNPDVSFLAFLVDVYKIMHSK